MATDKVVEGAVDLANNAKALAAQAEALMAQVNQLAGQLASQAQQSGGGDSFVFFVMIFVLSCFVGYYVVWSVTPALHSPLMSLTNAISSVIIVGALIAAGPVGFEMSKIFGLIAIGLAAVNIFGGFAVTQRMLAMYKKKERS
jgi:NAD(P) transhydrogenase subunit alpha